MQAWRLCQLASAVLLTSLAGGTDLQKTKASDSGLRGPVRQCIEQTTYGADGSVAERRFTTTSMYSPGGLLLEIRNEQSPGPEYVTTYAYNAAGHVVKVSSGNEGPSGTTKFDTTYAYDDKGQLLSVSSSTGDRDIRYEHDEHGRNQRVEHFPVFPARPNVAIGAISWENSELQFGPPSGGTVTTIYDEQDRPVEGQVRDATGRVMMRIVRIYDEQRHVQADKLIPEDMQSNVPEELGEKLNDAQKKAVAKFIGNAFASGESTYKYDAQGRVVEKHAFGGVSGDTLTKISYNDHGDVSDEITISTPPAVGSTEFSLDEAGNMFPVAQSKAPEPSQREVRYAYEYDGQGNWTKKTMAVCSEEGEFKTSSVVNRTLSYY